MVLVLLLLENFLLFSFLPLVCLKHIDYLLLFLFLVRRYE